MASMGSNPRITKKERGLIKGALRRVFARSELRNAVVNDTIMLGYSDIDRPRVKTWCYCKECETPHARSNMVVDHVSPIVNLHSSFEEMTIDELVDKLWCDRANLNAICYKCHELKSKAEMKQRREYKKASKKKLDNS